MVALPKLEGLFMPDVKCLKDGRFAVTNAPQLPIVDFKEGDILTNISDDFSNRLIELEYAELTDSNLDEVENEDDKKPSWAR